MTRMLKKWPGVGVGLLATNLVVVDWCCCCEVPYVYDGVRLVPVVHLCSLFSLHMLGDRLRLKIWSHKWKFYFSTVCSFLFFASLPYFVLCLYPVCYLYCTGILLHTVLHFLPVSLFVHALIMCYGTVVYSVSEGGIGYYPRLE